MSNCELINAGNLNSFRCSLRLITPKLAFMHRTKPVSLGSNQTFAAKRVKVSNSGPCCYSRDLFRCLFSVNRPNPVVNWATMVSTTSLDHPVAALRNHLRQQRSKIFESANSAPPAPGEAKAEHCYSERRLRRYTVLRKHPRSCVHRSQFLRAHVRRHPRACL